MPLWLIGGALALPAVLRLGRLGVTVRGPHSCPCEGVEEHRPGSSSFGGARTADGAGGKGGYMRRLLRWAFNFATVVSLLVCLGAAVMWGRTRSCSERWSFHSRPRSAPGPAWSVIVYSLDGQFQSTAATVRSRGGDERPVSPPMWGAADGELAYEKRTTGDLSAVAPGVLRADFRAMGGVYFLGLAAARSVATETSVTYPFNPDDHPPTLTVATLFLYVPYWMAVALAAALPTFALARAGLRRRRASRPGCCPACAYDLRATPEAGATLLGRCPECGAVRAGKEAP